MNFPDPALLEIFSAEQAEHLQRMRPLAEETGKPGGAAVYEELLRHAHTLKGAARAVGFELTEILMHALEDVFSVFRSGKAAPDAGTPAFFLRVLDAVEDIPAAFRAGRPAPDIGELLREMARLTGGRPGVLPVRETVAQEPALPETAEAQTAGGQAASPETAGGQAASRQAGLPETAGGQAASRQAGQAETAGGQAASRQAGQAETLRPPAHSAGDAPPEFVRIDAGNLDDLMRASSELVAAADTRDTDTGGEPARAEAALREWRRLRQDAAPRIRTMREEAGFASVLECIEGAERQIQALAGEIRAGSAERRQREWDLRRLTDQLDESALRVRMVSAETVFGGFGPMLRNLAREHGKRVDFRTEGLDLPADRLVLQALKDPVMHLLRNALSHGIEPENERVEAGKPAVGTIRLILRSRGERMQMTVEDDGRGIDYRALAEEARRQGLPEAGTALSEGDAADLIFRPGFSTAAGLTTLSGRGVGLSIVRHEVHRLHGEIHVESEPQKGLRIVISVPLSLSSQQILLVSAAGHTFGFLFSFVERVYRFQKTAIRTIEGKPVIVIGSEPVNLLRLADLLNLPASGGDDDVKDDREEGDGEEIVQAAVIAVGGNRAALAVDRLLDVRDAVVRPTGLEGEESGFSAGAIPLPEGDVAVILNAQALAGRFRQAAPASALSFAAPEVKKRRCGILVVDDSVTTRSLEKSLLEAHGYGVEVAVDGVEALEKLRRGGIDLVISDILMPRMDGFELLENIRRDGSLRKIPLIIVSSLEKREDRERGLALGADAYVVKRKFDQAELLRTVRQII